MDLFQDENWTFCDRDCNWCGHYVEIVTMLWIGNYTRLRLTFSLYVCIGSQTMTLNTRIPPITQPAMGPASEILEPEGFWNPPPLPLPLPSPPVIELGKLARMLVMSAAA